MNTVKELLILIKNRIADEYACFVHALYIKVKVECYSDIAYIADKYNLVYIKSKLYKSGELWASFKYRYE